MSNSMYSVLEKSSMDTDSIAFASAMEEEVTEDPFAQRASNDSDFEPLHASDAARRLLDDNSPKLRSDEETAPFAMMGGVPDPESLAPSMGDVPVDNSHMRNSSLLERIQQQKKQQPTSSIHSTPSSSNAGVTSSATSSALGYSMTQENYSYASGPESTSTLKVPQYSSAPRPNPYDTSSDYKDKMMNVLSAAGSIANSAAKGAVSGTKYIYGTLVTKTATSGGRQSLSGNTVRMGEMDYQRESLLMDPHDLEDSAAAFASSTNQQQKPPGMNMSMSGLDGSLSMNQQAGSNSTRFWQILVSVKQFLFDMKELFLTAPRYAQITVVGLFVLIMWLLFSEV